MGISVSEIERLLGNHRDAYGYGWNFWYHENIEPTAIAVDLDAEVVAKGGPTGYDYEVWFVIKVTDLDENERFFRKTGYHSSYEGYDWDGGFSEVFPKQKTVTVYEKG